MKKNDTVFYKVGDSTYRARVENAHRDGMVTVRPLFAVAKDGTDIMGTFLGDFTVRMFARDLSATHEA